MPWAGRVRHCRCSNSSLRLRTEVLGERHPNTFRAMSAFATALKKTGRAIEALPYHERAFALQLELCSVRSNYNTLTALSSYASALYALGRTAEALTHYERVLAAARPRCWGRSTAKRWRRSMTMAGALAELDRKPEALYVLSARTWPSPPERLARSIPIRLAAMSNYAVTQWQVDRSAEALVDCWSALCNCATEVLGGEAPIHPRYSELDHAVALIRRGAPHAEALQHFPAGHDALRGSAGRRRTPKH